MAFLSKKELEALLPKQIDPFRPERIKDVAYELSLGNEVYQTDSKTGKKEILDDKNCQIEIKPGQFTLLLTEENITIPKDKIALISIKAGIKLKGLINVSGFHVDPGFKGQLLFSVYNAGPATIMLDKGQPYFTIWFCDLNEELTEKEAYNGDHQNQSGIPAKYIEALKSGELASPNALMQKIKEVEAKKIRIDWLITILIGAVIGVCVKVYWDNEAYENGYQKGYKEYELKTKIDSTVNKLQIENKTILHKFDSVLNIKTKLDSAKKH